MAAIFIASHLGATVIATTRNPDKTQALLEAFVDHIVIDEGSLADLVRLLAPEGVDCVVELVGKLETIKDSLFTIRPVGFSVWSGSSATNGTMASPGPHQPSASRSTPPKRSPPQPPPR